MSIARIDDMVSSQPETIVSPDLCGAHCVDCFEHALYALVFLLKPWEREQYHPRYFGRKYPVHRNPNNIASPNTCRSSAREHMMSEYLLQESHRSARLTNANLQTRYRLRRLLNSRIKPRVNQKRDLLTFCVCQWL